MSEGRERGREDRDRQREERGMERGMEKGKKRGERERKAKEIRDALIRNWVGETLPQLTNSNSEIIKTEKYDPDNN